ncbi:MAG: hypothetical protein AB1899_01165 [Pseudomonadota bacterium]
MQSLKPATLTRCAAGLAATILLIAGTDALAGATWSPAATLATASQPATLYNPAIAANGAGKQVAVWVQDGQVQARIQESGVWGPTSPLSPATGGGSSPSVAVAADGSVTVAWIQDQGNGHSTLEAAFLNAGQWGLPATVSNAGISVTSPRAGVDGTGQATLAWAEADAAGTTCAIQTATGRAATGWSQPLTLANTCHGFVYLDVNGAGEAVVGWSDQGYLSGEGIYAATRDASGLWSAVSELAIPKYRQYLPGVAIGEDGTAVVVWDETYTGLNYSRKRRDGAWSPTAVAYAGIYSIASLADVAVDGQGNATAVFLIWTMLPSGAMAYPLQSVQLKNTSGTWSKPIYVTAKSQNISDFTVEASPGGSVAVAWLDYMTGKSGVASMLPGETRWSNVTLGKGSSEVALDMAAGHAATLWTSGYSTTSLNVSTAVAP